MAMHHYTPYIGPGKEVSWDFMRNYGKPRWVKRGLRVSEGNGERSSIFSIC